MPQLVPGVSLQIHAVILSESDIAFQQALDSAARAVFQQLKWEYEQSGQMFVTLYSGPRLVLQACPANFEIVKAAQLSPAQFQYMVSATNGHAPVVDMLIQKRLELFEQGRFHDARMLTGDVADDGR